jgi:hypothetical protein
MSLNGFIWSVRPVLQSLIGTNFSVHRFQMKQYFSKLSLVIECATEKVTKVIMFLKSIDNKNSVLISKNECLNTTEKIKLQQSL